MKKVKFSMTERINSFIPINLLPFRKFKKFPTKIHKYLICLVLLTVKLQGRGE